MRLRGWKSNRMTVGYGTQGQDLGVESMPPDKSALSSWLIVGAGLGGIAPLFAAAYTGSLRDLLDRGVTILEQRAEVGSGELGRYTIRSDSAAEAFLDVVLSTTEPRLAALQGHPIVSSTATPIGGLIQLPQAAEFLNLHCVATELENQGNAAPHCRSFPKVPSSLGLFIDVTLLRGWFSQ